MSKDKDIKAENSAKAFKKDAWHNASWYGRNITARWLMPINQHEDLLWKDFPDMTEPDDEIQQYLVPLRKHYERNREKKSSHPFVRAILRTFWRGFVFSLATRSFMMLIQVMIPAVTAKIYDIIRNEDKTEGFDSYIISIVAFASMHTLFMPYAWHYHHTICNKYGMRGTAAGQALLFQKMMNLQTGSCPADISEGHIMSIQGDMHKIQQIIHHTVPDWCRVVICLTVGCYYCLNTFGTTFLVTVFISIAFIAFDAWYDRFQRPFHKKVEELNTENTALLSEVFNNIKFIKLYGWQSLFQQKIISTRDKINATRETVRVHGRIQDISWSLVMAFLPTFTFVSFVLNDGKLNVAMIFIAQDMINSVFHALNAFPHHIKWVGEISIWEDKLIKFLDVPDTQKGLTTKSDQSPYKVQVKGDFTWGFVEKNNAKLSDCLTLKNIDLKIKEGEIFLLVGAIGSGKTSMLNAIGGNLIYVPEHIKQRENDKNRETKEFQELAEELSKIDCSQYKPIINTGDVSIAEQKVWIENKTIQDTILFDKPMNKERYEKTIESCCLTDDLSALPGGDQTELGENGINLSGGQKARIALARAVYSDSEVLLLDDIISALDATVGKKVFNEVLRGICKGKTIVLATHAVDFFHMADKIVILDEGEMKAQGSFTELQTHPLMKVIMDNHNDQREKTLEDSKKTPLERVQTMLSGKAGLSRSLSLLPGTTTLYKNQSTIRRSPSLARGQTIAATRRQQSIPTLDRKKTSSGSDFGAGQSNTIPAALEVYDEVSEESEENSIDLDTEAKFFDKKKKDDDDSIQTESDSDDDKKEKEKGKLIKEKAEKAEDVKVVDRSTYMRMLKQTGGVIPWVIVLSIVVCKENIFLGNQEFWAQFSLLSSVEQQEHIRTDISKFLGMVILQSAIEIGIGLVNESNENKTQKNFFVQILDTLMKAPVNLYHEVTPISRITGFFTSDISEVNAHFFHQIQSLFRVNALMILITVKSCISLPMLAPLYIFNWFVGRSMQSKFTKGHKNCRGFYKATDEAKSIHNKLSFSGRGVISIYQKQDHRLQTFYKLLQDKINCDKMGHARHQCEQHVRLGFRTPVQVLLTLVCIYYRNQVDTVLLIFIIQRTEWITHLTAEFFNEQQEVEKKMQKVQKLVNLENIAQEIQEGSIKVGDQWSKKGHIKFDNLKMRYRPTTDLVLKGLNFEIKAGDKVGIVGRTGAGKSTLGLTLLRIIEAESGKILIDGEDISKIELQILREKVTTIPQDPVLFKGTLRYNIDPFETYDVKEIDDLLTRSGLTDLIKKDEDKPTRDYMIEEGGSNLSAGEKQLICICRAVLRQAKIVIFDEATANIDIVTETKVLDLIKKEFAGATVLTIAHRLNTIIKSDKIAVMSYGTLAEYDSPQVLIQRPESEFSKLLHELEEAEAEEKKDEK